MYTAGNTVIDKQTVHVQNMIAERHNALFATQMEMYKTRIMAEHRFSALGVFVIDAVCHTVLYMYRCVLQLVWLW